VARDEEAPIMMSNRGISFITHIPAIIRHGGDSKEKGVPVASERKRVSMVQGIYSECSWSARSNDDEACTVSCSMPVGAILVVPAIACD
jgi:hypothetical protein